MIYNAPNIDHLHSTLQTPQSEETASLATRRENFSLEYDETPITEYKRNHSKPATCPYAVLHWSLMNGMVSLLAFNDEIHKS